MKKTGGLFWIILGTMLLLSALFLVFSNFRQDSESGKNADRILSELKEVIPQTTSVSDDNNESVTTAKIPESDLFQEYTITETVPEPEPLELDGNYYIGIIWIPSLNIELPVLSEWSYPNLKISPCRYRGTVQSGDIIIAAHNYRSHFGLINQLNSGDSIVFTDINGISHNYEVIQSEMIDGYDIESMEFGSAEGWDLTLFTCTLSGQSRVTVRAIELK